MPHRLELSPDEEGGRSYKRPDDRRRWLGERSPIAVSPVLGLMMLPGILRRLFAPRSVPEDFKRNFPFSLALRPKQLRAAADESAYLIPATARVQLEYQNIACPVRLTDQLVEKEQTVRLDRVLSGSMMQLVPHAGHMVHYVNANLVSRVVGDLRYAI
jgi:hypothetical protein